MMCSENLMPILINFHIRFCFQLKQLAINTSRNCFQLHFVLFWMFHSVPISGTFCFHVCTICIPKCVASVVCHIHDLPVLRVGSSSYLLVRILSKAKLGISKAQPQLQTNTAMPFWGRFSMCRCFAQRC